MDGQDKIILEIPKEYKKTFEYVKKDTARLQKFMKKHTAQLKKGVTNEQKRGAEITAQKKQAQKEWFYQNIWTVYKIDGIKGIKDILARAVEKGKVSVKELIYTFTMENNKFSKSLSTLQNWHTEFKKRNNDSQ